MAPAPCTDALLDPASVPASPALAAQGPVCVEQASPLALASLVRASSELLELRVARGLEVMDAPVRDVETCFSYPNSF